MDKSKIVDYNQYYCPAKWNEDLKRDLITCSAAMPDGRGGE